MKQLFTVSMTYSQITPESAADGDFSETGFVYQDDTMTLREVIEEVRFGIGSLSEMVVYQDRITIYQPDFNTICYRTGTQSQEAVHISAKPHQINRLVRVLKSKISR